MWKKTDKWRPCRLGTASGGGPVEETETGDIGFAKSQFPHREKLASDLARRVGVTVPRVVLETVEGNASIHAISFAHGRECIDIPLLRERSPTHFNSAHMQEALKQCSGLIAFHAWLATQDLKDDHLVVATDGTGAYNVAAIDFAFSLAWPEADGGPVQAPAVPGCQATNIDKDRVAATVASIEAVKDDEIRALVNSLPDQLVNSAEKERLANGLIARRGKIRQVMTSQGWLP